MEGMMSTITVQVFFFTQLNLLYHVDYNIEEICLKT
jgi:hypothetical protein